ncbi:MAG: hypothetical protein ACRC7N_04100 [Clostridium sp.]
MELGNRNSGLGKRNGGIGGNKNIKKIIIEIDLKSISIKINNDKKIEENINKN